MILKLLSSRISNFQEADWNTTNELSWAATREYASSAASDAEATARRRAPKGSIGDRVWNDENGNGIQDPGEAGLGQVSIKLLNADGLVLKTTVSDAQGVYQFGGLAAGAYRVLAGDFADFAFSPSWAGSNRGLDSDVDADGRSRLITLSKDQVRKGIDIGLVPDDERDSMNASVGDRVWADLNGNNLQDVGEPGRAGIVLTLYSWDTANSSGASVGTTTTNAAGEYRFDGLAAGDYRVQIEFDGTFTLVNQSPGSDPALDSDFDPATLETATFALAPGQVLTAIDAGIFVAAPPPPPPPPPPVGGMVGDRVWNDLNNNGLQDAGEPAIAGLTVKLTSLDGFLYGAETVTDAEGRYTLTAPVTGGYTLSVKVPDGYALSPQNQDPADLLDSDFAPVSTTHGRSYFVDLAAGVVNTQLDLGLHLVDVNGGGSGSSVSGRVFLDGDGALSNNARRDDNWEDYNLNGIKDRGEADFDLANVGVKLYDASNRLVGTTTTDVNGQYQFAGLSAGIYQAHFASQDTKWSNFEPSFQRVADPSYTDVDPITGFSQTLYLGPNQALTDIDASLSTAKLYAIGDTVFNDLNGDGLQNAGESGIAGIRVTMLDPYTGARGTTMLTDETGRFQFNALLPPNFANINGPGGTLLFEKTVDNPWSPPTGAVLDPATPNAIKLPYTMAQLSADATLFDFDMGISGVLPAPAAAPLSSAQALSLADVMGPVDSMDALLSAAFMGPSAALASTASAPATTDVNASALTDMGVGMGNDWAALLRVSADCAAHTAASA